MAVVHLKSSVIPDYLDPTKISPDPQVEKGRPMWTKGTVANAATDSQGSTYLLARLPSNCVLTELTKIEGTAWGFAQVEIGTKSDVTALINAAKAATNPSIPVAFASANDGKQLWEVLGLAEDPRSMIDIYAHGAAAAAAGAGTLKFQFHYLTAWS